MPRELVARDGLRVDAGLREIGEEVRDRLLQAFLALDPTNPEHQEVLGFVSAVGYVPATSDDFEGLRAAAEGLGLLGAEGGTGS